MANDFTNTFSTRDEASQQATFHGRAGSLRSVRYISNATSIDDLKEYERYVQALAQEVNEWAERLRIEQVNLAKRLATLEAK